MNVRDVMFLARAVFGDGYEIIPSAGEAAAAERLRRAGFVQRDPTVKIKPYIYVATETGRRFVNMFVAMVEIEAAKARGR